MSTDKTYFLQNPSKQNLHLVHSLDLILLGPTTNRVNVITGMAGHGSLLLHTFLNSHRFEVILHALQVCSLITLALALELDHFS